MGSNAELNITFLFGSGADTDCNKKLKSGDSFAEILIKNKYNKEVTAINPKIKKDLQLIYHTSTKVFLKTVETYSPIMKKKDFFDSEKIDKCLEYIGKKKHNSKTEVEYKEIQEICYKWYKTLKDDKENEIKKFFLEKAVFFDTLDEKFNALREVDSNFTNDALRVITAYFHVFISIFIARYNIASDKFEWNFENIFQTIKENTDKDKKLECDNKAYYAVLKESNIPCNIVTTNYTDLCERITKNTVTYLHGKLSWFEDLKHLTVYDCTDKKEQEEALNNKEHLIPFILIPSGVKPLICTKQMEEFHNFIKSLNESDFLVVNGYAFNSEDNHVNSVIGEWLRKSEKHKLIYFDYKDNRNEDGTNEKSIFSKLNWAEKISEIDFYDILDTDLIFEKEEQLISIKVDSKNSRVVFENFLNSYKNILRLENKIK